MFTIPPLTSDILAVSLDGKGSPSISLKRSNSAGGSHAQGWGFGWYPDDHSSAMVAKDSVMRGQQVLLDAITDWSNFRSTLFFCKVNAGSKGYSHNETQPFSRSFAGCDWLFLHNGHLDKIALEGLHSQKTRLLEPLGNTDSELVFCKLLAQLKASDARRIADVEPQTLHQWFKCFDGLGSADMFLSDGESMVCFHGSQSPKQLYHKRIQPPDNQDVYESEGIRFSMNDPRDSYRTAFLVSSAPFASDQGSQQWMQMQAGQLIVVRRGAIIWDSALAHHQSTPQESLIIPKTQVHAGANESRIAESADKVQEHILNARAIIQTSEGKPLQYRTYEVIHSTYYRYSEAVERSTHTFRLQPTDDMIQQLVYTKLIMSSVTEQIQYEDVFGNQSIHCIIDSPYQALKVKAVSQVNIFATAPDDHSLSCRKTSIPLVWMPWQRQMMMPYLLPSELPESQLVELTEYAMSFVERNDYHLLKTIEDMNVSIYRDYKYVSDSTSLNTTPFEVYISRQGVCQDFANLFICMARLLSIPARYRMGYIYTGGNYANKIQSDASHAWAEVYLPYIGWRGFDPTNGCTVSQDHIRVACGRNYRDATPTSGTIYKGGGVETLTVDVKMRELN